MARPITFKINVLKISKPHMFVGKKGTYLDCVVWPNKNGPDEDGNTHYIVQEFSKEARAAGEKGAIIGNLKLPQEEDSRPGQRPASQRQAHSAPKPPSDPDMLPSDAPF